MDEIEIAYYLDGPQLLLLLSLIDKRPVMGLASIAEPEDWQRVSLSLLEDGRLYCQDGRLVMERELSSLLLTIKDAAQVDTIYGKTPEPALLTLYAGKEPVRLEHLPGGRVRLCRAEKDALLRLTEEYLSPFYPMPEALLATLPEDETLLECLARWEREAVPMDASAALWVRMEEVRGVLERWTPESRNRWVWVEDDAVNLILRQGPGRIRAELDTSLCRQKLERELKGEAI